MLSKSIFGYVALTLTLLSNLPYIYSVLVGKTKPHSFTYVLWGSMTLINALGQYVGGAGPGAWASMLSSFFCFVVLALSFRYGEKSITRSDWVSLGIGLSAIPLWYVTSSPLPAVILATGIDALGYYPTFRKSYKKPHEEMIFSYLAANAKHIMAVLAMTAYSATTLCYPVTMFSMNAALVAMLAWRRGRQDQALPL